MGKLMIRDCGSNIEWKSNSCSSPAESLVMPPGGLHRKFVWRCSGFMEINNNSRQSTVYWFVLGDHLGSHGLPHVFWRTITNSEHLSTLHHFLTRHLPNLQCPTAFFEGKWGQVICSISTRYTKFNHILTTIDKIPPFRNRMKQHI
jgi:hypothetical protein